MSNISFLNSWNSQFEISDVWKIKHLKELHVQVICNIKAAWFTPYKLSNNTARLIYSTCKFKCPILMHKPKIAKFEYMYYAKN